MAATGQGGGTPELYPCARGAGIPKRVGAAPLLHALPKHPMPPIDWTRMWRPEQSPLETVLRATIVYVVVHTAFRVLGRRELRRHTMAATVLLFLVAVALREAIVTNDRTLTTAFLGFGTLLVVDRAASVASNASARMAEIIDGPVRELVRDGTVNERELSKAHITREHLLAAVRERGGEDLARVRRAYLERSGKISVVFEDGGDDRSRYVPR
jgi:uncharacterized membrane protein YcaP (DUF421 family)